MKGRAAGKYNRDPQSPGRGLGIVFFWCCLFLWCMTRSALPAAGEMFFTMEEAQEEQPAGPDTTALYADASFHPEAAIDGAAGAVQADLSQTDSGYVALRAWTDNRLKFQVLCNDLTYTYDLSNEGVPGVFPLQCGNGTYTFRVMENVTGTKYAMLFQTQADVWMADEFQPFIRPNDYSRYTAGSACVAKAAELAAGAADPNAFIAAVYDFVCSTVSYDMEKAMTVETGYLPDPDETMLTGKGICFDYSSLAVAMLRSQGIPTKMVFGYVAPDDLFHAWNMFYTPETGWVTVDYQVSGDTWNRLDLTFSASGAGGQFIGDGSNYTGMFYY